MAGLFAILTALIRIAFISVVAYLVIKRAIQDALKEFYKDNDKYKNSI
jgi:hypothetical protein